MADVRHELCRVVAEVHGAEAHHAHEAQRVAHLGDQHAEVVQERGAVLGDAQLADVAVESHRALHRVLDLLRAAANAGAGVIIVLHELAHAAFVADDAVLMAGGRIVAQGAAADVLTRDRLREVYGLNFTVDRGPHGQLRIHSPF